MVEVERRFETSPGRQGQTGTGWVVVRSGQLDFDHYSVELKLRPCSTCELSFNQHGYLCVIHRIVCGYQPFLQTSDTRSRISLRGRCTLFSTSQCPGTHYGLYRRSIRARSSETEAWNPKPERVFSLWISRGFHPRASPSPSQPRPP